MALPSYDEVMKSPEQSLKDPPLPSVLQLRSLVDAHELRLQAERERQYMSVRAKLSKLIIDAATSGMTSIRVPLNVLSDSFSGTRENRVTIGSRLAKEMTLLHYEATVTARSSFGSKVEPSGPNDERLCISISWKVCCS